MIHRALLSIALLVGLACAEDYSILMSPTYPDAYAVASELGSFSSSRSISSTSDTIRANDATILLSGATAFAHLATTRSGRGSRSSRFLGWFR